MKGKREEGKFSGKDIQTGSGGHHVGVIVIGLVVPESDGWR
jgi:hypothetical protein